MIGIYCITNNRNGKKYVGQSVDVSRRIHQHFSQLRKGEHPNEAMQKDFNTDGHFFQVTYLELNVPQNMLGAREKYWIEYYKTRNAQYGYNIQKVTPSQKYTKKVVQVAKHKDYLSKLLEEKKHD